MQSRLATISSNAVTRPNLHSSRGHAFCLCGSAELVAQIFSTEANPSNQSSAFLSSNCRRQEDALGEYVLVEGVREAGWPVWRQEQSGLLLFRCALQQGGRTWQPFVRSKNGNENFHQVRIYNFRVKCVVFACNRKFAKLTQ